MQPVNFRHRRWIALVVTGFALLIVWAISWIEASRLSRVSFISGGTLFGALILLTLLGVRRRIPVLRLGTVSTWTQVHIYTGLFALGVYVMHVPAIIAGGVFESMLSILFLVVSVSGLYGLYASRTLPKRLTAVAQQYRFDRVTWHRIQIAESAKSILNELKEPSGVQVLGSFYQKFLSEFFNTRPSLAYVIAPSGVRRRRLLSGLTELDRYLERDSRGTAGRLAALVRRRDDLDYQFALQLRLRTWVVVHSVFSLALIVGSVVHLFLTMRFTA